MRAYFVARANVTDLKAYRGYQKGVLASLPAYGGRPIAVDPAIYIEGEEPLNFNVIVEFPDMEKARRWYASEEYKNIVPLRNASSDNASAMFLNGVG